MMLCSLVPTELNLALENHLHNIQLMCLGADLEGTPFTPFTPRVGVVPLDLGLGQWPHIMPLLVQINFGERG